VEFTVVWFILIACLSLLPACSPLPPQNGRVVPSYDDFSRRLMRLSADQDGDGRHDQWTYVDGNRTLRGEADTDADGKIDRWEYFGPDGALTSVGTSSRNDGVEDSWAMTAPAGETHLARSTARDRVMDRHEYFRGETLLRVEEDTNRDGLIDKWDRYEGAVLREVAFDMTFSRGRADRRATYDARGRFIGVEIDPDGDGTFVAAPGEPEKPRTPGAL
jgi:hypothetical protein